LKDLTVVSTQETAAWGWDWSHLLGGATWPAVSAQLESNSPRCQGWQHSALWQRRRQTRSVTELL